MVVQFLLELVSGAMLSTRYDPAKPFGSASSLHHTGWRWIQAFHYWESSLLILESVFFLGYLLLADVGRGRLKPIYYATLLIFLSSVGFQISGNALPGDRHGVQTAVIEASIGGRAPFVGPTLQSIALSGSEYSSRTIPAWYTIHISLTALAAGALILAWWGRRTMARRVAAGGSLVFVLPGLILACFFASPLGDPATAADVNAFADRASWYTWPLHGALMMFSRVGAAWSWIGAILLPLLLIGLVALNPLFRDRSVRNRLRGAVAAICLLFTVAAVGFGGPIDGLTGTRNPPSSGALASKRGSPINRTLAAQGLKDFQSAGCEGCHGERGLKGKTGPSLAKVYLSHPEADYFVKYVQNPQSVDSNSTMPAFPQLSPGQLREIAEYLRSPDKNVG